MASMFVCTTCGYVGHPVTTVKGNVLFELLLWCFFIVPGIIYSIWRGSTNQKVCPKCRHSTMIPSDTPLGAKLLQEHRETQPATRSAGGESFQEQVGGQKGLLIVAAGIFVLWALASVFGKEAKPSQPQVSGFEPRVNVPIRK